MPNPKVGTVTPDVAHRGEERQGRPGAVPRRQGRHHPRARSAAARSSRDKLQGNLRALIEALNKAKPASSKGIYLRKVAVSSTMGVGVRVDAAIDQRALAQLSELAAPAQAALADVVGRAAARRGAGGPSKTVGAAASPALNRRPQVQPRELLDGQRRWRSRRRGIESSCSDGR